MRQGADRDGHQANATGIAAGLIHWPAIPDDESIDAPAGAVAMTVTAGAQPLPAQPGTSGS